MKALFIHNPADLNAKIQGGVQICSQEFLNIVQNAVDDLLFFEVEYNKSIYFRLLHKLNLDCYKSYDPRSYKNKLRNIILDNQITHIFLNKAELLRFSKILKQLNIGKSPAVIIMSHGNESGDLIGDLTSKNPRFRNFFKITGIIKLGITLFIESWYRRRFIDLVCTMSEEENAIEKWLGLNNPFFLPRVINKHEKITRNPDKNTFGYVGTLNHTPNISALKQLFKEVKKTGLKLEIRIAGQPADIGRELERKYTFIKYLGPLNEVDLLKEVKSWGFFINPIFNYSRGASMKLAKAIEWEIPVITTTAGRRGYLIKEGDLIETTESAGAFAEAMGACLSEDFDYESYANEIIKIKKSGVETLELAKRLRKVLDKLSVTN